MIGNAVLEREVSTLSEIFSSLSEPAFESESRLWFRGVERASYALKPSLLRVELEANGPWQDHGALERWLMNQFASKGSPYFRQTIWGSAEGDDDWNQYFAMQHYGLPTRLLDWTGNVLMAAYFAIVDIKSGRCKFCGDAAATCNQCEEGQAEPAAIWVLDPVRWNRKFPLSSLDPAPQFVPSHRESFVSNNLAPKKASDNWKPIAILPALSNPRIEAQQGTFTIHGLQQASMETLLEEGEGSFAPGLARLLIKEEAKSSIREELARQGVTANAIYPSLESICGDIKSEVLA
jgi:hypothetical protein